MNISMVERASFVCLLATLLQEGSQTTQRMLLHLQDLLQKRIILASGSPRRKEILHDILQLKNIEVIPSDFPENLDKSQFSNPSEYVKENALQKGLAVQKKYPNVDIIISADTVVYLEENKSFKIMETPKSDEDAFSQLRSLRGKCHFVTSGVCVLYKEKEKPTIFSEITKVHFHDASDKLIEAYIQTKEPHDKAGSYGIQGIGAQFVTGIEGDYWNVVGFPVFQFCKHMAETIE